MFLILREATFGRRTFASFRDVLGIATDVLSARLSTLVDVGILERVAYREPGQRTRSAYDLTPAGRELALVLVSLQQWAEVHLPVGVSPRAEPCRNGTTQRVRAVFVDDDGAVVESGDVRFVPSPVGRRGASPSGRLRSSS